ncbi:Alpha- and gamma-adaptin-binding protein p34, partial [Globisporangium polare]
MASASLLLLPPPPLVSAALVCRSRNLEALPHVSNLVSSFLDFATPEFWSVKRSAEKNGLRLLQRVAARESADTDPYYKAYVPNQALANAVRHDNLEMVSWLCLEYCPSVIPMRAIEEAAALGNRRVLQWLFANHQG